MSGLPNFFCKLPMDLAERSRSSVLISAVAIVVMLALGILEFVAYSDPPAETQMVLEPHRAGRLAIHLSMDFKHARCETLNVEVKSSIFRKAAMDRTTHFDKSERDGGCRITGSARTEKAAGYIKIHLAQVTEDGKHKGPLEDVNLSHTVRYLSFTDELDVDKEKKVAGPTGYFHPLIHPKYGTAKVWTMYGPQDEQTAGMHSESNQHHDYNLQVVPKIEVSNELGYMYTWTESTYEYDRNQQEADAEAIKQTGTKPLAVTFHFQLSPITIKRQLQKITLMGALMNTWAMMGGVYVSALLFDGIVHRSKETFGFKKAHPFEKAF